MKVGVLTVDDVTIPRWHWWSNWIDVAVFDYGGGGALLQMQVSRRNAKRFKVVDFKSNFGAVHASINDVGNLTQMKADI